MNLMPPSGVPRAWAVAAAARLRIPEERALSLFHATATGTILTLLNQPEAHRDMTLSTEAREAAIWALTGETGSGGSGETVRPAIALKAGLPAIKMLNEGERLLLSELLDRISGQQWSETRSEAPVRSICSQPRHGQATKVAGSNDRNWL